MDRDNTIGIINISLAKRVFIQGFFGLIAGAFILHPLSMAVHDIIEFNKIRFIALSMMFSAEHITMMGYFTLLGCIIAMLRALYIHKREEFYEEIRLLSLTDGLTSVYNRRYFDIQINKEIDRSRRYSHSLSLLIIDLNDFKKYNDTFGHLQGDILLKEIAVLLKSCVRNPDFVVRYGGDEFVIVMPESDKDSANKLSERLHSEIEAYSLNNIATQKWATISFSVGIAAFPSDSRDIDGLFRKADERLYKVKRRRALYEHIHLSEEALGS